MLFILCVEVLGIAVRNNVNVLGYRVNDFEVKIEQFADDCTFILDGSRDSFVHCLNIVSNFSTISGLCLNIDKTKLLWLGNASPPEYVQSSEFGCIRDKFKYLGIIFTRNLKDMNVLNFELKIIDIANLLKGWLRRKLSVYGKRIVLKALALSKLTNVLTTLPRPPIEKFQKLQKMFFEFFME